MLSFLSGQLHLTSRPYANSLVAPLSAWLPEAFWLFPICVVLHCYYSIQKLCLMWAPLAGTVFPWNYDLTLPLLIFRKCLKTRAEPILGSVTRFGRVSDTRQYSVLRRHKPADTEY